MKLFPHQTPNFEFFAWQNLISNFLRCSKQGKSKIQKCRIRFDTRATRAKREREIIRLCDRDDLNISWCGGDGGGAAAYNGARITPENRDFTLANIYHIIICFIYRLNSKGPITFEAAAICSAGTLQKFLTGISHCQDQQRLKELIPWIHIQEQLLVSFCSYQF